MIEKEKLIKYLETDWVEACTRGIEALLTRVLLNKYSHDCFREEDERSLKELRIARETIRELIEAIRIGKLDEFQKL